MKKTILLAIICIATTTVTSCHHEDRDETQSSLTIVQSENNYLLSSRRANGVNKRALFAKYNTNIHKSYTIPYLPEIGNQGIDQSCVAWSTTYAAATILERNFINPTTPARSPRYVYNQINKGACTTTPGIIEGLNILLDSGACSIKEMPYIQGQCSIAPDQVQRNQANSHKFTKWTTVDNKDLTLAKTLLANKFPLIISIPMNASFGLLGKAVWTYNPSTMRENYNTPKHAVCIVGFDDSKKAFKVMNSYGVDSHDSGFFWIGYDLFMKAPHQDGAVVMECYTAEVKAGTLPTY
ncbi:hypothetical protein D1631_06350 [Chryseobacterium nematophagum]|uniref:Peptidase C1A papain C-terminal domain-containing protein n=1 Tax=Chryseobacterium nematophagum TaxID=2305228 RepID=A0A3M7TDB3_9FLAO|nr:C1 family peptidase [Chryseobacterium nematophagum]RNA61573.1 hypothetical protein D1631_06350 [Chryseobacterium nematophagum]